MGPYFARYIQAYKNPEGTILLRMIEVSNKNPTRKRFKELGGEMAALEKLQKWIEHGAAAWCTARSNLDREVKVCPIMTHVIELNQFHFGWFPYDEKWHMVMLENDDQYDKLKAKQSS